MKPMKNFNEIESNDFSALPAGGYVCKILSIEDVAEKQYLQLVYDIAEGSEKGRYSDEWGKEHPKAHTYYASYKDTAEKMFKGFITALEKSNNVALSEKVAKGLNEQELVGMLFGALIGYEEYYDEERAEVKQRTKVRAIRSADVIRSGAYKVPDLKKLENKPTESANPFTPATESVVPGFNLTDDNLPF